VRARSRRSRVALGVVLLVDLALRARNLTAFYTDAGVLPRSLLAESYPRARFSLYAVSGASPTLALPSGVPVGSPVAVPLIAAVAATALAIGYRTRTATAVSLVLLASLQARNPFVLNAGDTLFWQLLGPIAVPARRALVGGRGPAARRVGKAIPARERPVHRPRLSPSVDRRHRGLRLERSREAQRRGLARGEAIETVFRLTYLYGLLGGLIPESPALLAAATTYGWLALLVASPLLLVVATGRVRRRSPVSSSLLISRWRSRSRSASFRWCRRPRCYLSFRRSSGIGSSRWPPDDRAVPVDGRAPPSLFLRSSSVGPTDDGPISQIAPDRARLVTVSPPPSPRSSSSPLLAWTAMGLGVVAAPEPVAAVSDPAESDWDMFAPEPPSTDALVLATATTADGDRIDALLHGDPVATDRTRPTPGYPTARWRKHFSRLSADDTDRVDTMLAHLCDRATEFSGAEMESVTVSAVEVDVVGSEEVWVREAGTRECR